MSTIKTLKKIDNSNGIDENGQPVIYDLSDPENKVLKDLKKRGLIDYTPVYLKNSIGATQCSVTKEGLEYIEKHKESRKDIILKFVIPFFTFLLGLLSNYIVKFLMK